MACTPPQARLPAQPARAGIPLTPSAARWRWSRSPVGGRWETPTPPAAAKSGPPTSRTVEGRVEVRRSDNQDWVPLATGEHVCSGDALRTQSSSRATITLPDGGTLKLDENSALGLPEPAFGIGLADRAAARRHPRHQPRSALVALHNPLRQRGPRGHRVRHSRRRERASDRDRRARRRSRRHDPCRRAQRRRATISRSRRTAKRRPHNPTHRPSSACAGRATTRRSSIARFPGQTKSLTSAEQAQRRLLCAARGGAPRHGADRVRRGRYRHLFAHRPAERHGTLVERPARSGTRRPRGSTRAAGRGPSRGAAIGRRAGGAVARRAELRGTGRRRAHAARGAGDRARQRHRVDAPRRGRAGEGRCARRHRQRRPGTESGSDAKHPARRARLRQPAGVRHGRRRDRFRASRRSSSPRPRCRGSG